MKLNDEFIVTIDNMDYQGRGIARVNGITIFVENALPKEQVKIKIKKIKHCRSHCLRIFKRK